MKLKIKVIDLMIILLYMAIFKVYLIPQAIQQASKLIFIIIVLVYLFSRMRMKDIFNKCLIYVFFMCISSYTAYMGYQSSVDAIMDGVLYATCIYTIYCMIRYCAQINYLDGFIDNLYRMTKLYCMLSVISIFWIGTSVNGTEKIYLFGNKFSIGYFFMMLFALYGIVVYRKNLNHKIKVILIGVLSIVVSLWIHCATIAVAVFAMLLIYLFFNAIKNWLCKPLTIIISIVISGGFVFAVDSILMNSNIQYFINSILHKSLTLTGRIYIYHNLVEIINNRFWLGYGYNSGVIVERIGYGNAQNGLMELLINFGMIGVLIFFYFSSSAVKGNLLSGKYKTLYILMFGIIICSTVEISYNYVYYITIFLLYELHHVSSKNKNIISNTCGDE